MARVARHFWLLFSVGAMLLILSTAAAEPIPADTLLAVQVRRAFQDDTPLASFNLGVRVRQRIVTLWGSVPSVEIARKVEQRARQVPGVREVRSELTVVPPLEDERPLPAGPVVAVPATRPTEESNPDATVSLFAPIPGDSPHPSRPPPAPPPPKDDLAVRVEQLRYTDIRYRHVQAEVRGGVVVVRGPQASTEDVMRFAQAVAKLPGVERVAVEPRPR
jgi:hypothetical protein